MEAEVASAEAVMASAEASGASVEAGPASAEASESAGKDPRTTGIALALLAKVMRCNYVELSL